MNNRDGFQIRGMPVSIGGMGVVMYNNKRKKSMCSLKVIEKLANGLYTIGAGSAGRHFRPSVFACRSLIMGYACVTLYFERSSSCLS